MKDLAGSRKSVIDPLYAPATFAPDSKDLQLQSSDAQFPMEFKEACQLLEHALRASDPLSPQKKIRWSLTQGSAVVTIRNAKGVYDALVSPVQMFVLGVLGTRGPDVAWVDVCRDVGCVPLDVLKQEMLSLSADRHPVVVQRGDVFSLSNWVC